MGEHDDDRVHSGLSATVERSRSRKYQSTGMACPIESNQGESQEEQEHVNLSYLSIAGVMYRNMTVVTLGTTI
jgi:hypothetical protein